jgi:hypothetical protein
LGKSASFYLMPLGALLIFVERLAGCCSVREPETKNLGAIPQTA